MGGLLDLRVVAEGVTKQTHILQILAFCTKCLEAALFLDKNFTAVDGRWVVEAVGHLKTESWNTKYFTSHQTERSVGGAEEHDGHDKQNLVEEHLHGSHP